MTKFEPEIVAMCCNWCGYAGADLAGVSRVQYPPNVRIIRVMCSARVEPGHIIKILQMGADGVMVVGCHPGDCHYISGNEMAQQMVETTREMLRHLGMDDRLHLEWISAAEGTKFGEAVSGFTERVRALGPNPMKASRNKAANHRWKPTVDEIRTAMEEILDSTHVLRCIECGKCAASCPVTRMEPEYSPMLTVVRAMRNLEAEIIQDKGIWTCTTCGTCTHRCPTGADYLGFVRQVRQLRAGCEGTCSHGGIFNALARIMTSPGVKQVDRLDWVAPDMKVAKKGELLYFTGCLPYMDPAFRATGARPLDIARGTVRVLNKAGLKPVVMADERCCGHDQLWGGEDKEVIADLARLNINMIRKTGAKRVVASCPECYRTLTKDYPGHAPGGKLGFEVVHTSELFADLLEAGKIELPDNGGPKVAVTFHDPCRLGRHMGVFEPPRKVLEGIPQLELREMVRNRGAAACCGTSAWLNCGTYSKRTQVELLREARSTGASTIVTACPKCLVHFSCTLSEPGDPKLPPKPEVQVNDLSVVLAEAMGLMVASQ